MPSPLQLVVATNNNVEEKLKQKQNIMVKTKISSKEQELVSKIGDMGICTILTTNYTYELEQGFCEKFYCKAGKRSKFRKLIFDCNPSADKNRSEKVTQEKAKLYTCMRIPFNDASIDIWHIHGEAAKIKTIVLGHYNYGKLLSLIDNYIGNFKKRYEICKKK